MVPASLNQFVWWLLLLPLGGLAILSLAGFIPPRWRWFDIAGQFRVQYLVAALVLVFLASIFALWRLAILAAVIVFINLLVIWPWIFPWKIGNRKTNRSKAEANTGDDIKRLLLANVLRKNRSYGELLDLVERSQPDVIALVEPDQKWMDGLKILRETFPYQFSALRDDNYGLALLSKHPLIDCEVLYLTSQGTPTIRTTIEWVNTTILIYVTHPAPPKSLQELRYRQEQIEGLTRLIGSSDKNIIVCGDFNCTSWTKAFLDMGRQSGISDSSRGFGWQPTWPVDRWYLKVVIDHVLVSQNLDIIKRWRGSNIGSDHWPVLIDFKTKER